MKSIHPDPIVQTMRRVEIDAALPLMRAAQNRTGAEAASKAIARIGDVLRDAAERTGAGSIRSTQDVGDLQSLAIETDELSLRISPGITHGTIRLSTRRDEIRWISPVSYEARCYDMVASFDAVQAVDARRMIAATIVRVAGRAAHASCMAALDPVRTADATASSQAEWELMYGALTMFEKTHPDVEGPFRIRPVTWHGVRSYLVQDTTTKRRYASAVPAPTKGRSLHRGVSLVLDGSETMTISDPDLDSSAENTPTDVSEAIRAVRDPLIAQLRWEPVA